MSTDSATAGASGPVTFTVGDGIGTFTRSTGLATWNRYAAVNDEFVPIHMDDEVGRAAGFDGALGMGNLQISYLHCLLRRWAGEDARVESFSIRFRQPDRGGATTATGVISAVDRDQRGTVVTLSLWTQNDMGEKLATGAATVLV